MLSHPSHYKYTKLAEIMMHGGMPHVPGRPGTLVSAMVRTGWRERENLVGYPSMDHWGEKNKCQSFLGGFLRGCARRAWFQLLPEKS